MARRRKTETFEESIEENFEEQTQEEVVQEVVETKEPEKIQVSDLFLIDSPIDFDSTMTYFDLGVFLYMVNKGVTEVPKDNAMRLRLQHSERKIKSLGYIKG